MWPKNILYLLLNDLYLILWGIPIKNNSHFKTCINCLFLKESAPFIAKFLIAIEVRFVKRGSPPAIRWTVSRTCSDLSCRMITSPSIWSISPRSLDWTTKVYCSLTLKNINLYCYQSFHFFLNSLIFFLPLSIKQSGVWNALMSSTDCPAWFGNQRRGCLLFHFFCKHRTSLEKNKENKKKILDNQGNCLLEIGRIWQDSVLKSMWSRAYICNKGFLINSLNFVAILYFTENSKRKLLWIQQILVLTSTK